MDYKARTQWVAKDPGSENTKKEEGATMTDKRFTSDNGDITLIVKDWLPDPSPDQVQHIIDQNKAKRQEMDDKRAQP